MDGAPGFAVERTRSRRLALAAALLASALAAPAFAEPTAAEVAVARKAFGDAVALEKDKRWAEAEAKLREALGIKETPGLRYHLGFCLENQGKLVEALVEYDRAEEMLRLGAKAPDVFELVGPARDGVKKRVASVTLKLGAKVDGVVVELDGAPIKATLIGKALPQNPGKRVVTASAPGRQPFRRELELGEGDVREISIDLPAKGSASAPAPASAPSPAADRPKYGDSPAPSEGASASLDRAQPPGSARTVVLIGEAAFTVIALGAGVFFTLQKGDSEDEIDKAHAELEAGNHDASVCRSPPENAKHACSELSTLTEQRDRQANLALAGFIGAGVGAAATLATFLLWKPAPKAQAALRVTPVAAPKTLGLGVVGRF